ncbi:type II toxin-antitoxin system RatA family toxin [Paraneptunicella aestuarii]|uniref:type II toxin-antitoxin system RatA family toxin n=1 Tax=Paraneptunicella aestuarii TaxID=2831148 RepID=UPI001E58F5C8|nr:type II toxin-antitoxin system RatA family toxin [Paraneptunicella aestuarii]UAA39879.1 type II toxin-antitoxin system RatA family toxin [Paraneptunicella aestuarii]
MPTVNRSALVPFSAETMFDLVNDVLSYPKFLPGCVNADVHEESDSHMRASLLIKKAGVNQWFTTSNELSRGKHILMSLVDGPFTSLQGGWKFTALAEDACKIELSLEFEFSSKLVELAFGKVFSSIANNMVKAFTDRAKDVSRG